MRLRPASALRAAVFLMAAGLFLPPAQGEAPEGYASVTGPCGREFPRGHGAHPDHRTEWRYVTGNLEGPSGEAFGFQLTFFRVRLSPPDGETRSPGEGSAWRTPQVYLAHAALSDLSAGRHRQAERAAREALGLAGAESTGQGARVFLRDWSADIRGEGIRLRADTEGFSFELFLVAEKPPVLHGDAGYSRKGSTPERASCYYSLTRLSASGTLVRDGRPVSVRGLAWMDHEFSTAPLEPGLQGWDWFSLQLSDGSELMLYLLRQGDGNPSPESAGTLVKADGEAVPLSREDFRLEVGGRWRSPRSGARYPSRWRLRIPSAGIDLAIEAALADQEMRTPGTTGVTYWEGSLRMKGLSGGRPVEGRGYGELTGYDRPFDAPL